MGSIPSSFKRLAQRRIEGPGHVRVANSNILSVPKRVVFVTLPPMGRNTEQHKEKG